MKAMLVLAMLWAAACVSAGRPQQPDCSNSPAHACQAGDECRTSADGRLHVCLPVPPRPDEMSPAAVAMMDVGRAVQLGSSPDDVERVTAVLGRAAPAFQSCSQAGCVDSAERQATTRIVSWLGKARDQPTLTVEFCGRQGAWRVGHVSMNVTSGGGGAWGTVPRMRPVFAEIDKEIRKQCVR